MGQFIQSLKELSPEKRWAEFHAISRRTEHGSTAWTTEATLIQPQDGAPNSDASRVTDISTRLQFATALGEPEDARLTGATRSLVRRMLGLNISSRAPRRNAPNAAKSVKPVKTLVVTERVA